MLKTSFNILYKNKFKCILIVFLIFISIAFLIFQTSNAQSISSTKAYFLAESTKNHGNGDSILLENIDEDGIKRYGLIDTGNKVITQDSDGNSSTVLNEFLKSHGVEKLEFLVITHAHSDHIGDALTVIDNFNINELYIKEMDDYYSYGNALQASYQDVIKKAIDKNIKIIGVSYDSTINKTISPSATTSFVTYMTENSDKSNLFTEFTDSNTKFTFGSSEIELFNWEIFNTEGNIWNKSNSDEQRERSSGENNHSLGLLLTQGNKKAFFAGDINNLDKNNSSGQLGDEDRIKDEIGDVDFLKFGHHAYEDSNTIDYLDTLKPEFGVITNDVGHGDLVTLEYIKEKNIDYLYNTQDEKSVIAVFTNDDVHLGFETLGKFQRINNELVYIPNKETSNSSHYKDIKYDVVYENENVSVSGWEELKTLVEENKNDIIIDDDNKEVKLKSLIVTLNGETLDVTKNIEIDLEQKIVLKSDKDVTIKRNKNFTDYTFITNYGELTLGSSEMNGSIVFDGNKEEVSANESVIESNQGIINIYDGITIQGNSKSIKTLTRTINKNEFASRGSAINCMDLCEINMYGGNIINNEASIDSDLTLSNETLNYYYDFQVFGAGISLMYGSTLNMYGGKINNNKAINNANVVLNSTNHDFSDQLGLRILGSGISSFHGIINITGGEVKNNEAINNSVVTLNSSLVKSLGATIYGVGIYNSNGVTNIKNALIDNNVATLNNVISLDSSSKITNSDDTDKVSLTNAVRGINMYNSSVRSVIDNTIISNSNLIRTEQLNNSGTISKKDITDYGGGANFYLSDIHIKNSEVKNNNCQYGAGIYSSRSTLEVDNTKFVNNNATGYGGGLGLSNNDSVINNSIFEGNTSRVGGGVSVSDANSNTEFNNVKVKNNSTNITNGASGGGIYAYGTVIIKGSETEISNNTAKTSGGGLMLKTGGTIENAIITNNIALGNSGGGICFDNTDANSTLVMNNGSITNNTAKVSGGGVFYKSVFVKNGGVVENNKPTNYYPDDIEKETTYTITYNLNGGTNDVNNPTSYKFGEEKELYNAIKEGYQFAGWYKDENFTEKVDKIENTFNASLTLYAKWVLDEYQVEINVINGTLSGDNNKKVAYNEDAIFTVVPNEGYENAIVSCNNSQVGILDGNELKISNVSNNTMCEVVYQAINYRISYNANGGIGEMSVSSHTYDVSGELSPNKFIRNGYKFIGWSSTKTGEVEFIDQETVKNLTSKNNSIITLYAIWQIETYNITYKLDGGEVNNKEIYTVETDTFKLNNPVKEGYKFIGWTGSNGEEKQLNVAIEKGSFGDKTFVANYEEAKYKITYKSDEFGSITGKKEEEVKYKGNPSGTTQVPLESYKDLKWAIDKDVTLTDGTVIKKGDQITEQQIKQILVKEDLVITIYHYLVKYTVNYESSENGVISGIKSEEVALNKSPLGTDVLPNKGYKLSHYVSNKTVSLSNGDTILSGSVISKEQLLSIVVKEDLKITIMYEKIKFSIKYQTDGNGKITGTLEEEKYYQETLSGTLQEANKNYEFLNWTVDKDVTLKDGTVIKKGESVFDNRIKEILVENDMLFTAHYGQTVFTVYYKADNMINITGDTKEEVKTGDFIKGTFVTTEDVNANVIWKANKDVVLKDGTVIKQGNELTMEQITQIKLDSDLILKAYSKNTNEVIVPDTGNSGQIIIMIMGILLVFVGGYEIYRRKNLV